MTDTPQRPAGLFASLRTLAHDVLDLLATRGELAALEIADARDLLRRSIVLGAVAAVMALATLSAFALWIAVLFWDGPRALAVGLVTVAYAAGAAIAVLAIRRGLAAAGPVLGQTRAVLRRDYEALRGPGVDREQVDGTAGSHDHAAH